MIINGSSEYTNISELPALKVLLDIRYLIPTLIIALVFSLALNYIKDYLTNVA